MNKFTTTLLTLGLGVFTTVSAQKMYWTESTGNVIKRANLDGTGVETLVNINNPGGIAIDATNSKMYFIAGVFYKADLDGSNSASFYSDNSPKRIALDVPSGKMYYTDALDGTNRTNLDGTGQELLMTTGGFTVPVGLALDLTNSKLYITEKIGNKIRRANLDGSSQEDLLTGLDAPSGIKLDVASGKMYWIEQGATDKIRRANLDGTGAEDLVSLADNPGGIDLDLTSGKMYWTVMNLNKIQRADLDGTNVEDLVTTGLNNPLDITFGPDDAPLSVELNSFSARQIENSISLNWSTASETENEGFNIYRKTGENNFVQIASHKSHRELKGQGNTSFETNYTFVDNSKLQNNEFYTYVISDVETNGLETKHEENTQTVKFILGEENVGSKQDYVLAQNFPNPFNPSTTISYQIAKDTKVSLKIYNEKGDFVKELANGFKHEGSHNAVWDGTDNNGKSVSSGTYFYKISAGTFTKTNKMILLK